MVKLIDSFIQLDNLIIVRRSTEIDVFLNIDARKNKNNS